MPETRKTTAALLADIPTGLPEAVSVQDLRNILFSLEAVIATVDPGVNDDDSQGHDVGRKWVNTVSGNIWTCTDASTGAAVWSLGGQGVQATRQIATQNSLQGGGDLSADRTLDLVGDEASPGADQYYGTDGVGSKGFHPLPAGGSGDMTKAVYDPGDNGIVDEAEALEDGVNTVTAAQARSHIDSISNPHVVSAAQVGAPPTARSVGTQHSLEGGGDLSANRTLNLVGDVASPGADKVYGTNGAGVRGWKDDPAGGGGGGSVVGGGQLVKIAESELGADAASIDLSSLDLSAYEWLEVVFVGRSAAATADLLLRFNGDSGAIYDSVQSGRHAASGAINTGNDGADNTAATIGRPPGSGASADYIGVTRLRILNHNDASKFTIFEGIHIAARGATDTDQRFEVVGGQYRSKSAITQLTFLMNTGNILSGSFVRLYGVLLTDLNVLEAGVAELPASNPALSALLESSTNGVLTRVLKFDDATEESAQFRMVLPPGFQGATIDVEVRWSPDSAASGGVVWGVQALALNDDDALDQAFGTEATAAADTATAVGDLLIAAVVTVTPSNSPAAGDTLIVRVARKVGDAGDTMTGDANLQQVVIAA